jgi:ribosomal protein L32
VGIERSGNQATGANVVMVECPKCGHDIRRQRGFADHWCMECPANPANEGEP